MKRIMWALVLLGLGMTMFPACSRQDSPGTETPGATAEVKNIVRAPDFSISDLNGEQVTLSQFRDEKVVLLVFGGTWCHFCQAEIPDLKRLYDKYRDRGFVILNVYIQEDPRKVAAFVERNEILYPVLIDVTGEVARRYQVVGVPFTVVIDREGIIQYCCYHPRQGFDSILDGLLPEKEGQAGEKTVE